MTTGAEQNKWQDWTFQGFAPEFDAHVRECPFLYLGVTLSSILHGLGYPGITFVLNLIACGIRILFVLFALPVYGIRGYLCGLLISQAVMALLSIGILLRQTHPTSRSASAK